MFPCLFYYDFPEFPSRVGRSSKGITMYFVTIRINGKRNFNKGFPLHLSTTSKTLANFRIPVTGCFCISLENYEEAKFRIFRKWFLCFNTDYQNVGCFELCKSNPLCPLLWSFPNVSRFVFPISGSIVYYHEFLICDWDDFFVRSVLDFCYFRKMWISRASKATATIFVHLFIFPGKIVDLHKGFLCMLLKMSKSWLVSGYFIIGFRCTLPQHSGKSEICSFHKGCPL